MTAPFMRSRALSTLAAALAATALFVILSLPITRTSTGHIFQGGKGEPGVIVLHALVFMLVYWGFVYLWDAAADDGEDV